MRIIILRSASRAALTNERLEGMGSEPSRHTSGAPCVHIPHASLRSRVCVSGAFTLDASFFICFIVFDCVLIFKNRGLKSILQALSTGVRLLDQELL